MQFRSLRVVSSKSSSVDYGNVIHRHSEYTYDMNSVMSHAISGRWWWRVAGIGLGFAALCWIPLFVVATGIRLVNLQNKNNPQANLDTYCKSRKIPYTLEPDFAIAGDFDPKADLQYQHEPQILDRLVEEWRETRNDDRWNQWLVVVLCTAIVAPIGFFAGLHFVRQQVMEADRGYSHLPKEQRPGLELVWERNWNGFIQNLRPSSR